MPPPSSGGLALLQTLALLSQSTDLARSSAADPQTWLQLASAQAWADADPYMIAGVYASVTVKPFKKVLP